MKTSFLVFLVIVAVLFVSSESATPRTSSRSSSSRGRSSVRTSRTPSRGTRSTPRARQTRPAPRRRPQSRPVQRRRPQTRSTRPLRSPKTPNRPRRPNQPRQLRQPRKRPQRPSKTQNRPTRPNQQRPMRNPSQRPPIRQIRPQNRPSRPQRQGLFSPQQQRGSLMNRFRNRIPSPPRMPSWFRPRAPTPVQRPQQFRPNVPVPRPRPQQFVRPTPPVPRPRPPQRVPVPTPRPQQPQVPIPRPRPPTLKQVVAPTPPPTAPTPLKFQAGQQLNRAQTRDVLIRAMSDAGITNPRAQANILANIEVESRLKPIVESMNYSPAGLRKIFPKYFTPAMANQYGRTKGRPANQEAIANIAYGTRMNNRGEGYKYRGRGYLQLTGRDNYERIGKKIGVDLVRNPELAARPDIAARIAAEYFRPHNGQQLNDITRVIKLTGPADKGSYGERRALADKWYREINGL